MNIRVPNVRDITEWLRLRMKAWPRVSVDRHREEMAKLLTEQTAGAAFVAVRSGKRLSGLIEVSIRERVDGTDIAPVGLIDAFYVDVPNRRMRVVADLFSAAEAWVAAHGSGVMTVLVHPSRKSARAIYKVHGYYLANEVLVLHKMIRVPAAPRGRPAT